MKNMIGYDLDDVLDLMGLQRRSSFIGSFLPAVGLVAIGAAVGAAVGLAVAPSSGTLLRQDLGHRFDSLRDRMRTEARRIRSEAERRVARVEKPALNAIQHSSPSTPHHS